MTTFDAVHVSNTILKRFFAADKEITLHKLHTVLYMVSAEYYKITGEKLMNQHFEVGTKGPVIPSVSQRFAIAGNAHITDHAKDLCGNVFFAKNKALKKAMKAVIPAVMSIPFNELRIIHHMESSAWRKSHNAMKSIIDDEDIHNDGEYKKFLLMRPCV